MALEQLVEQAAKLGDTLSDFVQAIDTDDILADVSPPELVSAMGHLADLLRFGHMIEASLCYRLTQIAAEAAGAA